jgi:hypothetical protein
LKKAPDGKTILVPQPSDDPDDPLNVITGKECSNLQWSWRKKHQVLFVIAFCAIIPDMTSAWGVPLIVDQSVYWGITTDNAGRSLSGNVFVSASIAPN